MDSANLENLLPLKISRFTVYQFCASNAKGTVSKVRWGKEYTFAKSSEINYS